MYVVSALKAYGVVSNGVIYYSKNSNGVTDVCYCDVFVQSVRDIVMFSVQYFGLDFTENIEWHMDDIFIYLIAAK